MIELLVTVSVLGAAAVGILPGLAVAARVARLLERQTKVVFLANSKLDELHVAVRQGVIPEEEASGVFRAGLDKIDWRMTALPIELDAQLRLVTLDLTWPRDRETDTYQVRTIVRLSISGQE